MSNNVYIENFNYNIPDSSNNNLANDRCMNAAGTSNFVNGQEAYDNSYFANLNDYNKKYRIAKESKNNYEE